jgi:hypothetical protein
MKYLQRVLDRRDLAGNHKARGTEPDGWVYGSITNYLLIGMAFLLLHDSLKEGVCNQQYYHPSAWH